MEAMTPCVDFFHGEHDGTQFLQLLGRNYSVEEPTFLSSPYPKETRCFNSRAKHRQTEVDEPESFNRKITDTQHPT